MAMERVVTCGAEVLAEKSAGGGPMSETLATSSVSPALDLAAPQTVAQTAYKSRATYIYSLYCWTKPQGLVAFADPDVHCDAIVRGVASKAQIRCRRQS